MTNNQQLAAHCREILAEAENHEQWAIDMARALLPCLEAKPVAYISEAKLKTLSKGIHSTTVKPDAVMVRPNALYTAPPVTMMHPDELRMDWLCAHCVEVREPLMYGSHAMFHAQQDSEEWDLPHHTTLREQIDEAIRAAGGSVKE